MLPDVVTASVSREARSLLSEAPVPSWGGLWLYRMFGLCTMKLEMPRKWHAAFGQKGRWCEYPGSLPLLEEKPKSWAWHPPRAPPGQRTPVSAVALGSPGYLLVAVWAPDLCSQTCNRYLKIASEATEYWNVKYTLHVVNVALRVMKKAATFLACAFCWALCYRLHTTASSNSLTMQKWLATT